MKNKPDAKLVELLKKGSHEAFTEIFDRYYIPLYHFARGRLSHDSEEAKDLIQDIFTKLWNDRETINIMPDKLPQLLFTAVKNKALDNHKHQKIEQKYMVHMEAYLNRWRIQEETDHLTRTNELAAKINHAIALLPEKMRIVFNFMKFSGMSRKQVSEHLGMPEPTVKTCIQRALVRLKKEININGFD